VSAKRYLKTGAVVFPLLLVVACLCEQGCVTAMIDHVAFQMNAADVSSKETAAENIMIPLRDGRKVESRWVHAAQTHPRTCTVILFNGIGGSLSDWDHVQAELSQSNISSIAFNYGDAAEIGQSRGKSRLHDIELVTNVLIGKVKERNGPGADYFLLGHSLGSAVVLQAYRNLDTTGCGGVILCNPFSSLKAWAIYHRHLPSALSFVMPNYYDNVRNIRNIPLPVLIVSSHADIVNPPDEALEVYRAANEPKSIKIFDGLKHNDLFRENGSDYWQPILAFIRKRSRE
jgi:alpha-beta hydrolase superfamily lysophospholipase